MDCSISKVDLEWLENRWNELTENSCFFDYIYRHYENCGLGEGDRYYHNLSHIVHCLREFDKVKHLVKNPLAVEVALWFHDIRYNPLMINGSNEVLSAKDSFNYLTNKLDAPQDFKSEVFNLILSTIYDDDVLRELEETYSYRKPNDFNYIRDIDLSSLGAESKVFLINQRHIQREAREHRISLKEFREYNVELLQSFLYKQMIYSTPYFQHECEMQARLNIVERLKQLR